MTTLDNMDDIVIDIKNSFSEITKTTVINSIHLRKMRQQLDILKTKIDIIRDHLIVNQVEIKARSLESTKPFIYYSLKIGRPKTNFNRSVELIATSQARSQELVLGDRSVSLANGDYHWSYRSGNVFGYFHLGCFALEQEELGFLTHPSSASETLHLNLR